MPDYRGYIGNCLLRGEEYTETDGKKVLNLIRVSLGGVSVKIIEDPAIAVGNFGDYEGKSIGTTNVLIEALPEAQFEQAQMLTRNLAALLSFATCSDVRQYGYYFPHGDVIESSAWLWGETRYFWPVLDTSDGRRIREYLEQTWDTYVSLRDSRQLDAAFYYFVQSNRNVPLEMLLIVTFVLLESLKHSYARVAGYPFLKGHFRPLGAMRGHLGAAKGFEELLNEMLAAVGMSVSLTRIVGLRNEIIHSGLSQLEYEDKKRIYWNCQDILREYLLRLLGYHGQYRPMSTRGTAEIP